MTEELLEQKEYHMCVALSENDVLGYKGRMPWNCPRAVKRFQAVTYRRPVIMGRKTFESIGKPLSDRTNIVLTRNLDYKPEGVTIAHSIEEVDKIFSEIKENIAVVIGGGEVFSQYLRKVRKIYLTRIDGKFKGDVYFDWNAEPVLFKNPAWLRSEGERKKPESEGAVGCVLYEVTPYL